MFVLVTTPGLAARGVDTYIRLALQARSNPFFEKRALGVCAKHTLFN